MENDTDILFIEFHMSIGVRCAALPTPDNADKLVWQDEIYGGATIFACKEGFTLVGDELRTCLGSGQWSGEQPVCIRK